MTTATAEKTEETTTENAQAPSQEEMEKVVTFVANDLLKNATLVDVLAGVPVNTLLQLLQNQSILRAKQSVEGFSEEEFQSVLDLANKPPESNEETSGEE